MNEPTRLSRSQDLNFDQRGIRGECLLGVILDLPQCGSLASVEGIDFITCIATTDLATWTAMAARSIIAAALRGRANVAIIYNPEDGLDSLRKIDDQIIDIVQYDC